jgi:hypothetical protein
MVFRILLFALFLTGFSSCATYRNGQTPDDVYYSPERENIGYVQTERDENNRTSYNENRLEDRRLRQRVTDSRFRNFDDDWYWNYSRTGIYMNTTNRWTPFHGSFSPFRNNPFYCIPGTTLLIPTPVTPKNSTGVRYSPGIQKYKPTNNAPVNAKYGTYNTTNNSRTYNNRYSSGSNNTGNRSSGYGGSSSGSGGGSRIMSGSSSGSSGGGSSSSGSSSGGVGGRRN